MVESAVGGDGLSKHGTKGVHSTSLPLIFLTKEVNLRNRSDGKLETLKCGDVLGILAI